MGNKVYRSLGRLGSAFVTTNYDSWLDTEIPEIALRVNAPQQPQTTTANTPAKRRKICTANEFTAANLNLSNVVFHLHGSLADTTRLIMTTREYIGHYRSDKSGNGSAFENRILTFLDYLFSNKTVLFVGYGLEDLEILEYVIQKSRVTPPDGEAEARHFMLQGYFSHQAELARSMVQYYRQCNIQLIPFLRDQRDWEQLA